jgi:hypothetical protein
MAEVAARREVPTEAFVIREQAALANARGEAA